LFGSPWQKTSYSGPGKVYIVKNPIFTDTHIFHPIPFSFTLLLFTYPHRHSWTSSTLKRPHTYSHHVDCTTHWAEAALLTSPTPRYLWSGALHSLDHSLQLPHTITSNHSHFAQLTTLLIVAHIHTTSFHPQSNDLTGWLHRLLKSTLRTHFTSAD
jgi:hypothetical protein